MTSRQDITQMKIEFLKSILRLYEKPEVPPSARLRELQTATGTLLKVCLIRIDMLPQGKKIDRKIAVFMAKINNNLNIIQKLEALEDQKAARIKEEAESIVESIETDEDPVRVKQEEDTQAEVKVDNTEANIKMEDIAPAETRREVFTPARFVRGALVESPAVSIREDFSPVQIKREPSDY